MANSRMAFMGAGLAQGLEKATDTLLQIQFAKAKMAKDQEKRDVDLKYKKAQTEFLTAKLDATAEQAAQVKDAHERALIELTKANAVDAAKTGMALDVGEQGGPSAGLASMSTGGSMFPSVQQPTESQIQAQMAKDLPSGASMKVGGTTLKGEPTGGFGAAYIKEAKEIAPSIVEAVKKGDFGALDKQPAWVVAEVQSQLAKQGFDITKARMEYTGLQQWTKTMKQNQMVGLNTAFNTVEKDIPVMKDLNNELKRTNVNMVNKFTLSAKLQGISLNPSGMNKEQIGVASKFVTQLNLMRDNMAVAFMKGGVPSDQAFKLTDQVLNPIYGAQRIDSALDQLSVNVNLRKEALAETNPALANQQSEALESIKSKWGLQ